VTRTRGWLAGAFGVEHLPTGGAVGAVVILPPLGYEDTSAYRPLRALADALAGAGFHVVRLDWPGLGDADGDALDDDLPRRRADTIRAVLADLRERGHGCVAGIGVRACGLLALGTGGFDELVLWGVPASGRALLREEKAFHRMAARVFGTPPADAPALPQGAVEAGGFVMGPATVAALQALDVGAPVGLRRALVLGRDGADPPAELVAAIASGGAEVVGRAVPGLADLLEDPYRSTLHPEVREAVLGFLSRSAAREVGGGRRAAALVLPTGATERPWAAPGGAGELVGITCEPAGGAAPGAPWTVFFNAGGVRRSGPNRLWTAAARALAAAGVPSLRLDVRDVGDSDGASTAHSDLEAMYSPESIADAVVAIDTLVAAGAGAIDVVGLCSGAFLGVQAAAQRPLRRALLFNCLAFVWDDDARSNGMTSQVARSIFDRRRWGRLLTGRIDARQLALAMLSQARLRAADGLARLRGRAPASPVERILHSVILRGTALQLVSSEADPSIAYLERHVPVDRGPPFTSCRRWTTLFVRRGPTRA
jgi:alpha/beta superfamily hydrolase